jgi:uncharacterized membrane protein YphA (DoxX/SURF4 family)
MKPETLGYWGSTGLLAAVLLAGGCAQLAAVPHTVAGIHQLGYPLYLLTILGIWKVLGALTLLAPRLPRLKEWAYAGVCFDLSGAVASHAFSGDVGGGVAPLVLLLLAVVSWRLRPQGRAWPETLAAPPVLSRLEG